jgi:hypothetical protein
MDKSSVSGDVVWIETADLEIGAATSFGPRIMWCSRPGESNLLAELGDDVTLDAGNGRRYRPRGGHRLWVGPELPELTYQTDDARVAAIRTDSSLKVSSRADDFGLVKSIEVTPTPGEAEVVVEHTIKATASTTLDIAPWAITLLRPGGTAVMPLGRPGGPVSRRQAAHSLVFWPYTEPDHPTVRVGRTEVTIASGVERPTKLGTPLNRGWLAYIADDVVFVKRTAVHGDRFVDLGATGQIHVTHYAVQLETLGPITPVANDGLIHHRETWSIHDRPDCEPMEIGAALRLDGT